MGFIEDVTKTITKGGQTVIDKAKEIGDISRLNAKIRSAEGRKAGALLSIGKCYYEEHMDEKPSEEMEEFYRVIQESENEIHEAENELRKLKGIRNCKECGEPMSAGQEYCGKCGTKNDFSELDEELKAKKEAAEKRAEEASQKVLGAMHSVKDAVVESAKAIKEKAVDLTRPKNKAEEVADDVQDKAEDLKDAAEDTVENLTEEVKDAAKKLNKEAEEKLHKAGKKVEELKEDVKDELK